LEAVSASSRLFSQCAEVEKEELRIKKQETCQRLGLRHLDEPIFRFNIQSVGKQRGGGGGQMIREGFFLTLTLTLTP